MNTKVNFQQSIKAGVLAIVTAIIINSILFLIFHSAGVISDSVFIEPNKPLTIVPVIISNTFPTIIASIVFFLLEKFTNKGFKIFTILSVVLGLVSFTGPFMVLRGASVGYALVLNLMHVVVIGALLFFINKEVKKKK